jgi:hypothetical protein
MDLGGGDCDCRRYHDAATGYDHDIYLVPEAFDRNRVPT